ncbi:MAG: DUF1302 family protein [Sulfurovum sp.]|uniref:DUF1302 family protein n=1 Tax=Sulfurovum sp. TaxID=1969726 RepID=UPI002868354A|nr:DUF1302 family protein [Sulfurovum sp.]MCO4845299.1 DUF1302 family protein [Sulfurovum sp.]
MVQVRFSIIAACVLLSFSAEAEEVDMSGFDDEPVLASQEKNRGDELLDGFDDTPSSTTEETENTGNELLDGFEDTAPVSTEVEEKSDLVPGLTGKLTEQVAYSLYDDKPHDNISSLKSSLFLDYEYKFENGFKFKANIKAYYDAMYDIKGSEKFLQDELDELRSEVELFDAYIEGSISDNFDMKLGRQVVVWGRSDTIRVTDILNPLDNRRPGMVDIEDLRLPVAMAKFDYFIGDWRVTPIAILEQRFSKNPPYGSSFNPLPNTGINNESYSDVTYALSVGGEFSGWDVNFYVARIHNDAGQVVNAPIPRIEHDKVNMFGTALNFLTGSWLFKTELAYFDGFKYTTTGDKSFTRTDALLGVEYKGIADTLISYDIVTRRIGGYDNGLMNEFNPLNKQSYQHAFRVSSDFMNASLTANYLISLNGEKLDEGGFQRAWVKYELGEGINTNIGVVDYIGGSLVFDTIKDNDMVFADISYSF